MPPQTKGGARVSGSFGVNPEGIGERSPGSVGRDRISAAQPLDVVSYHRSVPLAKQVPLQTFRAATFACDHSFNPTCDYMRIGARRVYKITENGLTPVVIWLKTGQEFGKYATPWEMRFSKLVDDTNCADPVVDTEGRVVGHYGWFSGDQLYVPKGHRYTKINELLKDEVPIFVNSENKGSGLWESYSIGVNRYRVVTAIDGAVLALTSSSCSDGAEAESVSPLDLIVLAKLAVDLGALGLRKGVHAFTSIVSRRTVAAGVTEEAAIIAIGRKTTLEAVSGIEMVREARNAGKRVVVNLGGTGEVASAINLNPNVVAPRKGIPNLIKKPGEEIGDVFAPNSIDEIVSNALPHNTIDWTKVLPGAHKVLRPGGSISISFKWVGDDAPIILNQLRNLGFKNIDNLFNSNAVITAVK